MKIHLKDEIIKTINYGYIYFISGMALGFDIIAAETVLQLKKDFPQIKLIAALPKINISYGKIIRLKDIKKYFLNVIVFAVYMKHIITNVC